MPRSPKKQQPTAVEIAANRHTDTRVNIPTSELRDFAGNDELLPTKALYPRDPSLDPQLVWQGKDEQDARDLAVPVVPIYIQEKIQPTAIVENVRAASRAERADEHPEQLNLFSDFNDSDDFDRLIEFYQHEQQWTNRMILGDSLLVMSSLAEKEALKGKVQTVYFDPPYGIKFGSNWQVSTRKRDVKDGREEDLVRQPEQVRAFRDTWERGIHSYLSYLRDRLVVARDLLTESGSIFVQIGDENVHLVRALMDEVFGSENFQAQINYRSMTALGQKGMANVYDYILWYSKETKHLRFHPLYRVRNITDEPEFGYLADETGQFERTNAYRQNLTSAINTRIFKRSELRSAGYTPSCTYEFTYEGRAYTPSAGKSWRTNNVGMGRLVKASRLIVLGEKPLLPAVSFRLSFQPV
jgi:adenine-specific DNA-methyltransferase